MRRKYSDPHTLRAAVIHGDFGTRLSLIFCGAGNIVHKQIGKGILFLMVELVYLWYMMSEGIYSITMLPSLGWLKQREVWNEAKGIYEYVQGHNSVLLLLYGIVTICFSVLFVLFWRGCAVSSYKAQLNLKEGRHVPTLKEDIKELFNRNLQKLLMALPLLGIFAFTVLPLIFMISMAFTSYSKIGEHLVLFDWVGLENFKKVLSFRDTIGHTFWSVLGWTICWAIFATVLNYILGMLLAIVINRKGTRGKAFWRFCFMLSVAIPQFVSLLIIRTMFNQDGIVNLLLKEAGLIAESLPFFYQRHMGQSDGNYH